MQQEGEDLREVPDTELTEHELDQEWLYRARRDGRVDGPWAIDILTTTSSWPGSLVVIGYNRSTAGMADRHSKQVQTESARILKICTEIQPQRACVCFKVSAKPTKPNKNQQIDLQGVCVRFKVSANRAKPNKNQQIDGQGVCMH